MANERNEITIGIHYRTATMETLVQNPGLDHIAIEIFAFLDPKSLAQCALVSKSWNNLICNHKIWWIAQLLHLKELLKLPRESRFRNRNECTDLINTFVKNEKSYEDLVQLSKFMQSQTGRLILDYQNMLTYKADLLYPCQIIETELAKKGLNEEFAIKLMQHLTNDRKEVWVNYFYFSAIFGFSNIFELMLKRTISTYKLDFNSPLPYVEYDRAHEVDIISAYTNTVYHVGISRPRPLLHNIVSSGHLSLEVLNIFLTYAEELNIDVNARDLDGYSPLHLALSYPKFLDDYHDRRINAIHLLLLRKDVDVNLRNFDGIWPFASAVYSRCVKCAPCSFILLDLVEKGAKFDEREEMRVAMNEGVIREIFKFLPFDGSVDPESKA